MIAKLPYMVSTGLVSKILGKIQEARRPERFTQDFLGTKLGHSGGSARPIIPLLKRMNFLGSDGVPTPLYNQFRNTETQGAAVAEGMRNAFSELFDRNEYVYDLSRDKLVGLIIEITGGKKGDKRTQAILATFWALKGLADFDGEVPEKRIVESESDTSASMPVPPNDRTALPGNNADNTEKIELKVGYTINLNLPETNDPEVFNAIFKALRDNLLRN